MPTTKEAMDAIAAAVAKNKAGAESAKTLIGEFAKYVLAHSNDPDALVAFANEITSDSDSLAAKVMENPDPDTTD